MTDKDEEYSLKESFAKLGPLPIPILTDGRGNVIDGLHRELIAKKLGIKILEVDVPLGVLLKISLPTKNPTQSRFVRIACNDWRRRVRADERARELIALRQAGMTPQQIADKSAYSYTTVLRYLPDEYKDRKKAVVGSLGGQARAKKLRSATTVQPKSEDTRQPNGEIDELEKPEETVLSEALNEPIETEAKFAERFGKTFSAHIRVLTRILEKDFPTITGHMSEDHDCNRCVPREACAEFLSFLSKCIELKPELPICMQKKLT